MPEMNEIIAEEPAPVENIAEPALSENDVLNENETGAAESAEPSLEEQLAAAQAEAEDYKDRWLRGQADFANARKRMDKERIEWYANATADVLKKLLPVLDDFERALATVPNAFRQDAWLEGMDLVQRKMLGILENFNVIAIEAVGHPFDPNLHEAITQEPAAAYESGVVCRELQKGYKIGDKVIRPSLVAVAE